MTPEQINARKAALVATTFTGGWQVAMDLADQTLKEITDAAMECDDETKAGRLLLKAQAARDFLIRFRRQVEEYKLVEVNQGFVELTY